MIETDEAELLCLLIDLGFQCNKKARALRSCLSFPFFWVVGLERSGGALEDKFNVVDSSWDIWASVSLPFMGIPLFFSSRDWRAAMLHGIS